MWLNKIAAIKQRKTIIIVFSLVTIILGISCFNSVSDDKTKRIDDKGIFANASESNKESKPLQTTMVPESFSALAEMASPAVVNIQTVRTAKTKNMSRQFHGGPFSDDDQMNDFFNKFFNQDQQREFKQRSLGSGFIIDKEGYIVTNNHVVQDSDKIKVILKNEKEYNAEIIGRDPNTDLALIKIKDENSLPVLNLGDSDALKVGQWVVAIGSPFGLEHTVTAGIVSAKGRVIGSGPYDDYIQTDASINPGNSGGPLLNMNGEVIGINTIIIAGGQGIGFAIPINLARGIVDQLKKHGDVTRGWLGITIQNLPADLSEYFRIEGGKGVLVSDVIPGDPADKAGIRPKDIITKINGQKIDSSRTLLKIVAEMGVGKNVKINILRDGKEKIFNVEIAKRTDGKIASKTDSLKGEPDEIGIRVANLTPEIARRYDISEKEGVIVIAIDPDGKAAEAGIVPGDIIKEINHQSVKTVREYTEVLNKVKNKPLDIFLWRDKGGYVLVKIPN
ncbi:MAG: Do family serine endopeptidase [Proteobacteria bacterium]|nr:Do family serine endopeptidase [Pseudomonadota bacterium]MBU4009187.1 Do family serine endopeptidase [Pseudomonadota bacterium]